MAGGRLTDAFATYAGPGWRAVSAGQEANVLDGSVRAGRYNRPGEQTLYMSSSPAGVAAAMARYGAATRTVIALEVVADTLVDLRDPHACRLLDVDASRVKEDWLASLEQGDVPGSWSASDRARALGASGLIDGSRRAPGEWHLVLFGWNVPGVPQVRVRGGRPSRE